MNFLIGLLILIQALLFCNCAMTQEDRDLALKIHNDLRRKVASGKCTDKSGKALPKASNMKKMVC